jgi:hypothetical protein
MQFNPLELKQEGSWIKRTLRSPQFKRTLIAILIGAVAGFAFYYFSEGQHLESIPGREIAESMFIGGFFGFFITNSPCARGRC